MRLTSLLLALAVLATACGGGSDPDESADAGSTPTTTAASTSTTSTTSTPPKTTATTGAPLSTAAPTTSTSTSTTVAASNTNVFEIVEGDCLNEELIDEQSSVPTVPCDQAHDSEVYTAFILDDGQYPGLDDVDVWAGEGCLARFEPAFREAYAISPYFISYLYPTEDSWNNEDDREVLCLASGTEPLTGSIVPPRNESNPVLAAAIAAAIAAPTDDGEPSPFPIEEASCAAGWIVNDIGSDRLTELGVSAAEVSQVEDIDFTDEELGLIVLAIGDCADIARLLADSLVNDGTLSAVDADCFAAEFDEEVLEQAFKVSLADPDAELATDEFLAEFFDVASVCDLAL